MRTFWAALAACVFLGGCVHNYYIKENLSPNQVVETTIIRKPSLVKSRIILPRYDDYLEGYISGQLFTADGKPLQGVVVKVLDKKEKEYPGFTAGVSNSSGVYKVRFSQPIIWKRIDIDGVLAFDAGWQALGKKTKFRLYFNRRSGDLVYTPEINVMVMRNQGEAKRSTPAAPPPPKKSSFDFDDPAPAGAAPAGAAPAAGPAGSKGKDAAPKEDDPFSDFGL